MIFTRWALYEILFGLFLTRLLVGWVGLDGGVFHFRHQVHGGVSNAIIFYLCLVMIFFAVILPLLVMIETSLYIVLLG